MCPVFSSTFECRANFLTLRKWLAGYQEEDASEEELLWDDGSMRAAGNRVNAAIRALLAAALLHEPRAGKLLNAMCGRVADIADRLVKSRQWGSDRVRAFALL